MRRLVLVAAFALLGASAAQTGAKSNLIWGPAPPSLPRGAKIAVVSGDPGQPGPFVIRLRFPPGYSVPPHRHPSDEHVTVINGVLSLGMGSVEDRGTMKVLGRGKSIIAPANMNHYASTTQGATLQISSRGPFQVIYANPRNDPRL
jgi:mannose-6-phosphate isomerase-like protein (cupin superfamily)